MRWNELSTFGGRAAVFLLSSPLHFVVQRVNMHWGSAGKRWAEGTSAQLAACVDYSRLQIPFPTDGGRKRGKQSPRRGSRLARCRHPLDCMQCWGGRRCLSGRCATMAANDVDEMGSTRPSCNTDQGDLRCCECLSGKLKRGTKVKTGSAG